MGWFLLNGKNLLSKDDESYLLTIPKLCRNQPLNIARLDPIQVMGIVNRKLETKSTGRSSLFWLTYLDLRLMP